MESSKDHLVETCPVNESFAANVPALENWLKQQMPDLTGHLQIEMFKDKAHNPTYKLNLGERFFVMRIQSQNDSDISNTNIRLEHQIITSLANTPIPVPKMLFFCENESIIGSSFFLMEFTNGRMLSDQSLPLMYRNQRREIYIEMNRLISTLHSIILSDFNQLTEFIPEKFDFKEHIVRSNERYKNNETDKIPEVKAIVDWLLAHIPKSANDSQFLGVVHGNFRPENLIFDAIEPRILSVLNWKDAQIGHKLVDFNRHCLMWHLSPGFFRGIAGLDVQILGIPTEEDYIKMYCERTQIIKINDLKADWVFYLVYNLLHQISVLQSTSKQMKEDENKEKNMINNNQHHLSPMNEINLITHIRSLAQLAWEMVKPSNQLHQKSMQM